MSRPTEEPLKAAIVPSSEPPAADLTAFLMRMGRPGAHLRAISTDASAISGQAKTGRPRSTRAIADAVIRAARAAGYLMPQSMSASGLTDGPHEVLSPAGRAAIRDVLISGPAAPVGRTTSQRRRTRAAALAASAGGQRPIERAALVEQLGQRRDAAGQPLLNDVQVAAALRLAQDFAMAQMQPRITARWSAEVMAERRRRAAPGAGVDLAATTTSAQARVRAALALLGGDLADVALDVCCFERGLEAIEAARHWSRGAARAVLSIALTRLAEHYGLAATRRAGHAVMQHWGDQTFRPSAADRPRDQSDV